MTYRILDNGTHRAACCHSKLIDVTAVQESRMFRGSPSMLRISCIDQSEADWLNN